MLFREHYFGKTGGVSTMQKIWAAKWHHEGNGTIQERR